MNSKGNSDSSRHYLGKFYKKNDKIDKFDFIQCQNHQKDKHTHHLINSKKYLYKKI